MRKAFLITCVVIAALVGAGAWWLWYCNVGSVPADMMEADMQISAGRFSVTNNNRFDWKNVTVVLDGAQGDYSSSMTGKPGYAVSTKGYTLKMPQLRAGATFSCDLAKFTNAHGARFDPAVSHSSAVIIYTEINGGESIWQGNFR